MDGLEEFRPGRHAEQVRIRAVCQAEELPPEGSSPITGGLVGNGMSAGVVSYRVRVLEWRNYTFRFQLPRRSNFGPI